MRWSDRILPDLWKLLGGSRYCCLNVVGGVFIGIILMILLIAFTVFALVAPAAVQTRGKGGVPEDPLTARPALDGSGRTGNEL